MKCILKQHPRAIEVAKQHGREDMAEKHEKLTAISRDFD